MAGRQLQGVALGEPFSLEKGTGKGANRTEYQVNVNGVACTAKRMLAALNGGRENESITEHDGLRLLKRFEEEHEFLCKIQHPNIVQFIGTHLPAGADPLDKLLVIEKLRMGLEELIISYPAVPLAVKLHVLRDVSSGLRHLHSHGVVHGDLKVANVLLTSDLQAKVLDLGVARVADEHFSAENRTQQAPPAADYMPPEALHSNPDHENKIDSFSFGHLALYLIIQEYPYPRDVADISLGKGGAVAGTEVQKRLEWIEKIPACSQDLRALVENCLQDEPFERPAMADIQQQLVARCNNHPKSLRMVALLLETKQEANSIGSLEAELQQFFPNVLGNQNTVTSTVTPDNCQAGDTETSLSRIRHHKEVGSSRHLISVLTAGLKEKKDLIDLARQAEDAERFEDMKEVMKIVMEKVIESGNLLELEERTMLGVAFKNVVAPRRASWRSVKQRCTSEGEYVEVYSKYLEEIGKEIQDCCDEILELLDRYPIDNDSTDNQMFFYKMQGDHLRYLAEVMAIGNPLQSATLTKSEQSFLKAMEIAKETKPSNLLRMAAALNLSVFYCEIHHDVRKALKIARETFDSAIADIEASKLEVDKESMLLLHTIQEHLISWAAGSKGVTYESPV